MSETIRRELFPGVWLRSIHTNKFKSSYLSVTLLAPLEKDNASANALVPYVLRRGTAAHPDMESLSAALDELYGGAIEPVVRKKGETQCVGFVASFLDDTYALEGEAILEPAANLLGRMLLDPVTEEGVFRTDYVEGERANVVPGFASALVEGDEETAKKAEEAGKQLGFPVKTTLGNGAVIIETTGVTGSTDSTESTSVAEGRARGVLPRGSR